MNVNGGIFQIGNRFRSQIFEELFKDIIFFKEISKQMNGIIIIITKIILKRMNVNSEIFEIEN